MKMKATRFLVVAAITIEGVLPNCSIAGTWTQTSALATNWWSLSCSADGTKLAAVNYISPDPFNSFGSPVYLSTDSGETWAPIDNENVTACFEPAVLQWDLITSSADGNTLFAAANGGPFYFSTNAGVNWTFTGPFEPSSLAGWTGLASSGDGSRLAATGGVGIFTSIDSGNTWTATSAAENGSGWTSVVSSADGCRLAATTFFDTIYISTNAGTDWFPTTAPAGVWSSIASSVNSSKLVAATHDNGRYGGFPGAIYMSADFGITWTLTGAPRAAWQSVASSADGNIFVAAQDNGLIYTSTNSGTTWNAADAPATNWLAVACSADGGKLFAVANGGGIWTSQTVRSPTLAIVMTNCLGLSWLIPSANFILQQSTDLTSTNWSSVTNTPVLNLTNLQNQVTLPAPASSAFYRLKIP